MANTNGEKNWSLEKYQRALRNYHDESSCVS